MKSLLRSSSLRRTEVKLSRTDKEPGEALCDQQVDFELYLYNLTIQTTVSMQREKLRKRVSPTNVAKKNHDSNFMQIPNYF